MLFGLFECRIRGTVKGSLAQTTPLPLKTRLISCSTMLSPLNVFVSAAPDVGVVIHVGLEEIQRVVILKSSYEQPSDISFPSREASEKSSRGRNPLVSNVVRKVLEPEASERLIINKPAR